MFVSHLPRTSVFLPPTPVFPFDGLVPRDTRSPQIGSLTPGILSPPRLGPMVASQIVPPSHATVASLAWLPRTRLVVLGRSEQVDSETLGWGGGSVRRHDHDERVRDVVAHHETTTRAATMAESSTSTSSKVWWWSALVVAGTACAVGTWYVQQARREEATNQARERWKRHAERLLSNESERSGTGSSTWARSASSGRKSIEGTIDACDSIRASLQRWRQKGNVSSKIRKKRRGRPLYISAPINALVEGVITDITTFADLLRYGNFGLGTFNQLDGEAVILDGEVYQLREDGSTQKVDPLTKTPFVCLTDFDPAVVQETYFEESFVGWSVLKAAVESLFESPNVVYALRITGKFEYVKSRAVSKAEDHEKLLDATKRQTVFEFENIEGSLVGFYTPTFLSTVHVPGFHLHFIDKECKKGGHLLDLKCSNIKIEIQESHVLVLQLPTTQEYMQTDLSGDIQEDLMNAES